MGVRFASFGVAVCVATLALGCRVYAAEPDSEQETPSRFRDSEDGKFDISAFLATAYGFIPLLVPITDPAVGYGAVAAAVFVHGEPPAEGEPFVRPTISVIGALKTENDTRGWFGANLGTWRGGRVRTIAALTDLDVNLEFFGFGGDAATATEGLGYSVKARGGVAGGNYRLGDTQLWIGLRYTSVNTSVSLAPPASDLPNVSAEDYDLRLGALTPSLTLDRRDNFFTPIRGWYVDLSAPVFRESFGGDRDFEDRESHGDVLPAARRVAVPRRACERQVQLGPHAVLLAAVCVAARRAGASVLKASERPSSRRSFAGSFARAGASWVSPARAKLEARSRHESPRRPSRRLERDFATWSRAATVCSSVWT